MVVPSKTYVSRSDGWSFGLSDVFDCQVRRYLDAGESFQWQDLLMLTEMALAASLARFTSHGFCPPWAWSATHLLL